MSWCFGQIYGALIASFTKQAFSRVYACIVKLLFTNSEANGALRYIGILRFINHEVEVSRNLQIAKSDIFGLAMRGILHFAIYKLQS